MSFSKQVRAAVAWDLVARIFARHGAAHDLAVRVLRPAGGTYFCVSLVKRSPPRPVLMANLEGTSLALRPLDPSAPALAWPAHEYQQRVLQLGAAAVAQDVESALALPAPAVEPPSPSVVGVRVIADVMLRRMLASRVTLADCGYCDSSDGDGGVRPWVSIAPELAGRALAAAGWEEEAEASARLWRLEVVGGGREVYLDVESCRAWADGRLEDLWQVYLREGRRVAPLADWIVTRLARRAEEPHAPRS